MSSTIHSISLPKNGKEAKQALLIVLCERPQAQAFLAEGSVKEWETKTQDSLYFTHVYELEPGNTGLAHRPLEGAMFLNLVSITAPRDEFDIQLMTVCNRVRNMPSAQALELAEEAVRKLRKAASEAI